MTGEEIERWRDALHRKYVNREAVDALCDLACRGLALDYENVRLRTMFDSAISQLYAIKRLMHPNGFVANGKCYSFHPPIELVRDAWEALSKAIRDIDTTALSVAQKDEP